MSDLDATEFQKSLKLARAALFSRDPKRRAMEEIELQMNTGRCSAQERARRS